MEYFSAIKGNNLLLQVELYLPKVYGEVQTRWDPKIWPDLEMGFLQN